MEGDLNQGFQKKAFRIGLEKLGLSEIRWLWFLFICKIRETIRFDSKSIMNFIPREVYCGAWESALRYTFFDNFFNCLLFQKWNVSEVLPDYYLLYKGARRKERTAWPQHTAKWRLSVSLWSTGMLRQGSWAGIWCCKARNIKWRCDFHIWLSQPGEFSSWRATSRTTIRSLPTNRRNFIFLQFFYRKQFIFIL